MQPLEKEVPLGEDHPSVEEVVSFMRGQATRAEARLIVRHLLAQCPQCVPVARGYWRLAGKPAAIKVLLREMAAQAAGLTRRASQRKRHRGGASVMDKIEAAREKLREIVGRLKEICSHLQEVQASLPEPDLDLDRLLEEDYEDIEDVEIEIRSVIGCVLNDSIGPAIRDLQDAAVYGLEEEEEGETGAQENASGEETE